MCFWKSGTSSVEMVPSEDGLNRSLNDGIVVDVVSAKRPAGSQKTANTAK
jgi:hypothetical protein